MWAGHPALPSARRATRDGRPVCCDGGALAPQSFSFSGGCSPTSGFSSGFSSAISRGRLRQSSPSSAGRAVGGSAAFGGGVGALPAGAGLGGGGGGAGAALGGGAAAA